VIADPPPTDPVTTAPVTTAPATTAPATTAPVTTAPATTAPVTATDRVEVRTGSYHDSVTLMQVSRAVAAVEGVRAAQVAMATELNVAIIAGMGFALPPGIGPSDLLVAVRALDAGAHDAALAALTAALAAPSDAGSGTGGPGTTASVPHRTTAAAARRSGAGLALISVPGAYAFVEAMDALEAGLDVMVFSDNVPVEQEVRLKDEAAHRGRLVMGPDCGTAVVGGIGLGFANVARPGPVGLVAASGTGAQQVICLLDAAGVGVRHCLGVGGRDLTADVGGRSARQAMALLDAEPDIELIVVVSKPPAPEVERALIGLASTLSTPVQFALLGAGRGDLTQAAAAAARAVGADWRVPLCWPARPERTGRYTRLRAGFAGGTLCDEAMLIATTVLGPIASNIPLGGAPALAADLVTTRDGGRPAHLMVDFGADELTRGRPHPMIDGSLRIQWLAGEAAAVSPGQGAVVLLDVVLGHAAHPDPGAELAPAVLAARATAASRGADLAVVISLCGTTGDPQGLSRQAQTLVESGASVQLSNAEAAREALGLLTLQAS
jgi:FdrA protein